MNDINDLSKGTEGIDFLRDLIKAFNKRDETINSNKSPIQLINEFTKYQRGNIDSYGNKTDQ